MEKFIKDIDLAMKFYLELQRIDYKGEIKVIGDITLMHDDIGKYDRYSLSISFPKCYPYCFPKVIELSKKIPRISDRHVNEDNTLCFAVDPEERLICKNGIKFKYFLDKVLVPHLSRETYRSFSGKYEDGEYSHGLEGLWEFFSYKLDVSEKDNIVKELERILHEKWQGRNVPCFCGSKIKFKNCHLIKWNGLMVLGTDYLQRILEILKNDLTA